MERVDVGVVTYNTRELSVAALRRLLDSVRPDEVRLLVRDNGSTDGTAQAIAELVPEAELDAGHENLGFARGVNSLIARSDAPWFLALNSDAWPEPGALGSLLAAGQAHPEAAAVAPRLQRPDGALEHSTHPFPSLRLAALHAVGVNRVLPARVQARMLLAPGWRHDRARPVDWAVGAALLLRRDAIDAIGGFDERFFMYAEDLEWCWRAHRRGWRIWFEPAAVVTHVGNASGDATYGDARTAAYWCNTYRFYRAEHGAAATLAYRSLNAVAASREWAWARARRDPATHHWGLTVRAHLAADRGPDGPPTTDPR